MFDEQYFPIDIVLDSAEVSSGTTDRPSFTFSPALEDVIGVSCIYANVPFTYAVVDGQNNHLRLTIAAVVYDIYLTPGTYTSTTLIQELSAGLRDAGYAAADFVFFIGNDTNQLNIYNAAGKTFELYCFTLRGAGKTLGFLNGTTYNSSNGTIRLNDDTLALAVDYIIAPLSVNLSGSGQMYLHCPELQSITNGAVRSGPRINDIIGFWPVNANYLGNIIYQAQDPATIPITETTISYLTFYLTIGTKTLYGEDYNVPVNFLSLKGQPYQIGLRFYKRNKLSIQNDGQTQRITTTQSQPRAYSRR